MTTLLRTLTRKSKMAFGKYRDYTVEEMLMSKKRKVSLIVAYYKLEKINFIDDVLEELLITPEWRIEKPSKDYDKCYEFLTKYYPKEYIPMDDKMKKMVYAGRTRKRTNKSYLQGKNHNR